MQPNAQFGAHEVIGMSEALMTKTANVELFSSLSNQVQDMQLRNMLMNQARMMEEHYTQGVQLMQGAGQATTQAQSYGGNMNAQPKLGLRNPNNPAPNLHAQTMSERAVCTVALNAHKFGALAGTTFALECTNPQFRTYLMSGASQCDRMAYDIWAYMNQKGYYQVPTLQQNTTQTMMQMYEMPQQGTQQGQNFQ
jgi:spore coat protein CotF